MRALAGPGTGRTDVGRWRIPRGSVQWAAVPPDPKPYTLGRDWVEASLSVKPLRARSAAAGAPQLLFTLEIEDERLTVALLAMRRARQVRGGPETLAGWDAQPAERILPTTPR